MQFRSLIPWLAKAALVLVVVYGCNRADKDEKFSEEAPSIVVTDDTAYKLELHNIPERIISVAPNVTETIYALGAADSLVAVTDICDYPPEAKEKPKIGSFVNPSSEKIMAFEPELVIGCGTLHPVLARLRELGVPVLSFDPRTVEEVLTMVDKVGVALGHEDQARKITSPLREELEEVASRLATVDDSHKVTVFVEMWHDPLQTAGAGSFVHELVQTAGAINVAASVGRDYFALSQEHVLDADPDVILAAYMERGVPARELILNRETWQTVSAVKTGRVFDDIDPDLLLRPSIRAVRTVKELAGRFYPKLFDENAK